MKLHPLANEYLFKYYAVLRRIFSNVLGQLEMDYVSIGLIDKAGQLFFLSSKPSIEQNLIEKNLLGYDGCFQPDFVYQDKPSTWTDLYSSEQIKLLHHYKQAEPGLEIGISIPADFGDYRVVFSFGFKSLSILMQRQLINQSEKLLAIGKYCLREIINTVPLPKQQKTCKFKPHLQLIINNQVSYENTTG
ncbi:MAG: flagellar biosynthesis protein FlgJ [Legionella sp.]